MTRKLQTALVAVGCALALVGCGSEATTTPAQTATPAPRVLSLLDAKPLALANPILTVPIERTDRRGNNVLEISPEGSLLVAVGRGPYIDEGFAKDQHVLQLLAPGAPARTIPTIPGPLPRAIRGADVDERTIVWLESSSRAATSAPWTLFAHDRARGITKAVATDADQRGTESSAADPMVAGDRLYWTAIEGTPDEEGQTNAYSRDLAAAEPIRREATDVADLSVDGDWMFWTTVEELDETNSRTTVHRRDLRTGAESIVAAVDLGLYGRIVTLKSAGPDVAWIEKGADTAQAPPPYRLVVHGSDGVVAVDGELFGGLTVGAGLLGWTGVRRRPARIRRDLAAGSDEHDALLDPAKPGERAGADRGLALRLARRIPLARPNPDVGALTGRLRRRENWPTPHGPPTIPRT
ncbi:MAG: hypothetical protein ACT4QG_16835 [Sporichthyaceae bacterium]